MYEVKPIIDQKKNIVDLPTTMYKVKSFYENSFVQQPSLGNHIVTNGVVSQYSSNIQLLDISQQIRNVLKVFTPRQSKK